MRNINVFEQYPVIPLVVTYETNVDAAREKIGQLAKRGRVSLNGHTVECIRDETDNTKYRVVRWGGESPTELGRIGLMPSMGSIYTACTTSRKNRILQTIIKEVLGDDLKLVRAVKNLALHPNGRGKLIGSMSVLKS